MAERGDRLQNKAPRTGGYATAPPPEAEELPTLNGVELQRMARLPQETRAAALELMAALEELSPARSGAGKWGRLLDAIEADE